MIKLVFPYHKDFFLESETAADWLELNGLGCPSKDLNDEVLILGMVVYTKYGVKTLDWTEEFKKRCCDSSKV